MVKSLWLIFSLLIVSSTALAQDTGAFKVGVILPLTGPLAEFGVALRNGIELAQQKEKKILSGLQFVYEDSQYSPQSAITIFRKLTSDSNVKFIINFGCPTSQAIVPLAEQTRTPTALFCSSLLLTKDKEFAFGMTSPANEWAAILWRYLQSIQFKNLCIVLTENDYLVSEYNALKSELAANGNGQTISVIDRYTPQDNDFRTSALKLHSRSCDALGVYMLPGQVRTFFDQTRSLKLKAQVFGTDIFESIEEIAASKGAMEGSVFVNLAVPAQFKERYLSKYHNENQVTMACVVHDLVIRVGKLLAQGDRNKSSETLMHQLQQSGQQSEECGSSTFIKSETGEQFVRFPIVLKHVIDGEIQNFTK